MFVTFSGAPQWLRLGFSSPNFISLSMLEPVPGSMLKGTFTGSQDYLPSNVSFSLSTVEGAWMTSLGYILHFFMLEMRWILSSNSFKAIYLICLLCLPLARGCFRSVLPCTDTLPQFLQGLTFPKFFHLCHLLPTFDIALNSFVPSHEFSLALCFTSVTSESPLSQQIQVMFAQYCVRCQAAESVLYSLNSFLTATSSEPSYCLFRVWGRGE